MRKITVAAALCLAALSLPGCSSSRLQQFQAGVSNFVAGVQTVNQAIATVSAQLATNCNSIEATAQALVDLTSFSTKAGPAISAANATIVAWCQAPPVDIPSAIRVTAAQVQAAQAAYKAAKAGT